MSTFVCWRNIILLTVNLVYDSLIIYIKKCCHSSGSCFLRNLSRKLNSVHVGLLDSYSCHFDVLLAVCHIFYLNHDKCFLSVWWLTNTTVYCSVQYIFTAVQQCSAHQTRCVCYNISLFVMQFLYKVNNTQNIVCCLFTGGIATGVTDHWHLKSTFKSFQTQL
jgi:hypothetical protein